MPSAEELQKYLLPAIGQPVDATLSTTDTALFVQAANAALLELLGQALAEDRSELVRAPVSVTLGQVTADDKAITFSGYADWMRGCSIQIGSTWNRLVRPGSSVSLEIPYQGTTASNVAATVYQDVVNLDYALENIQPPITLDGQYPITMVSHLTQLDAFRRRSGENWTRNGLPEYALMQDSLSYQGTPATRFLFDALPLQKYTLHFTARLRAQQIASLADTTPYFLPGGQDLLIFYPVARDYLRQCCAYFILDPKDTMDAANAARQRWAAYNNKGSQPGVLDIYG